jgi:hypothetical protein
MYNLHSYSIVIYTIRIKYLCFHVTDVITFYDYSLVSFEIISYHQVIISCGVSTVFSLLLYFVHSGMDYTKLKYGAGQARTIFQYKTIRTKILKCSADIYFNRQCLAKKVMYFYQLM